MTLLDASIVVAYVAGIFVLSWRFAVRQVSGEDYFLAGRRMGGGTLALSIMANQASAVSLIGAPAFVAMQAHGGLRWLQYELALPLAMVAVGAILLPTLRSVQGASIYEYIGRRFGSATRRVLAAVFVLSRGLALGVILYASALAIAASFGWSLATSMLVVGGVSVLYTSLGGIVADIWSDVVQLALLWGGTVGAALYLLARWGTGLLQEIPPERLEPIASGWGVTGGSSTFELAPMLAGGFFLYVSYYGCDQTQAQRLLTARDEDHARRALLWNGLLRFPLVLTYCGFGLLLAGLLSADGVFAAAMAGQRPDSLVPVFITTYLPAGLRGLFLAAILAAAMSSIDSALNSLAAVTLEDVAGLPPQRQSAWVGRVTTMAWGVFAVAAGLVLSGTGQGILDLINRVGSMFYGPVLAVFVLGIVSDRATGRSALTGLVLGLSANLGVAAWAPDVSWLWWNPIGFVAALVPALVVAGPFHARQVRVGRDSIALVAAFALMIVLLWMIGASTAPAP